MLVDAVVVTAVAFLHIISAIAWLGASIYFAFILGPILRAFSPSTALEFFSKAGSKSTKYFMGASTSTVIFGLVLLYFYTNGDFSVLPSSVNGQRLLVGVTLGLAAYLDAVLVTGREFSKANRIVSEMVKSPPQGPPTEFMTAMKKGGMGALIGTILLIITVAFMVVTGFPF